MDVQVTMMDTDLVYGCVRNVCVNAPMSAPDHSVLISQCPFRSVPSRDNRTLSMEPTSPTTQRVEELAGTVMKRTDGPNSKKTSGIRLRSHGTIVKLGRHRGTTYDVKITVLLSAPPSFALCAFRWSSKRPQRNGAVEDRKPSTMTSGARS